MRELSLFTGIGGGLLGTYLLGWTPVGYVEYDDFCQRVLEARIKDGYLPKAPLFGDIKAFISEGYADQYKGMVNVVTAGFPCQPFSVAGKKLADADNRNMWPETIDVIRRVRPEYAFLENVPGLLSKRHGYFKTILADLSESGYNAKWKVISASELGATHKRDRLFILATNSDGLRHQPRRPWKPLPWVRAYGKTRVMGAWKIKPGMDRVANGVPDQMDRVKAIGNGQVCQVVAFAWSYLTGYD